MTTKLEQQFFKVFGIEPEYNDGCKLADNYWYNDFLRSQYDTLDEYLAFNCPYQNDQCLSTCDFAYDDKQYPEITDRRLLELICIYPYVFICNPKNIEEFRTEILKRIIEIFNQSLLHQDEELAIKIRHQVQQLFKEEE